MSKGPENTFIASVHRHLPVDFYSMKNHNEYNGGIADCWYSGTKADLWVEYKYLNLPKMADTLIRLTDTIKPYALSKLQQQWLWGRSLEGRNVHVIVGCPKGGVIFTHPEVWSEPIAAGRFLQFVVDRKSIAQHILKVCT